MLILVFTFKYQILHQSSISNMNLTILGATSGVKIDLYLQNCKYRPVKALQHWLQVPNDAPIKCVNLFVPPSVCSRISDLRPQASVPWPRFDAEAASEAVGNRFRLDLFLPLRSRPRLRLADQVQPSCRRGSIICRLLPVKSVEIYSLLFGHFLLLLVSSSVLACDAGFDLCYLFVAQLSNQPP